VPNKDLGLEDGVTYHTKLMKTHVNSQDYVKVSPACGNCAGEHECLAYWQGHDSLSACLYCNQKKAKCVAVWWGYSATKVSKSGQSKKDTPKDAVQVTWKKVNQADEDVRCGAGEMVDSAGEAA
jgi:hypothetical protein